jgi:ATP synthase F1 delta subunit
MNTAYYELARKYAQAFINVFIQELDAEKIRHIKHLAHFLEKHRRVLFYVELSQLDGQGTKKAFIEVLREFKLEQLFESLILLLQSSQRLFLLPKVLEYIINLYNDYHNIMEFTIISSHSLKESEIKEIVHSLEQKTGKNVIFSTHTDKQLIAGIKLYSNTYGWEHSIRKQLRALEQTD